MKWHRRPLRILIVSASVGAGDAGNARELARRLRAGGHQVHVKDFLDAPALKMGRIFSKGYEAELRHAPWAYEAAFRMWFWLPFLLGPIRRICSLFSRKQVSAWAKQTQADLVVSTYPVATQVLGDMRRRWQRRWLPRGRHALAVPAVNLVTDFGYHPFWAHKGIDLNLAVHPGTAAILGRRTGRSSVTCEPLVSPVFTRAGARSGADRYARRLATRAALGLAPGQVAVLISSGSWGVGQVSEAFRLVAQAPGLVPVVTCGNNDGLRSELQATAAREGLPGAVLGWTDAMADLMAACDVLVENAGGLTSLEAMAAGLPVVSFRPIPGHGRNSARVMEHAGVSRWPQDDQALVGQLQLLGRPGPARRTQVATARALFSIDAARLVESASAPGALGRPVLRPLARAVRAAANATFVITLAWFGLTTGVGVAAATGLGVAHPPPGLTGTTFIGARLDTDELAAPAVQAALVRLHASAVVTAGTAESVPRDLRHLAQEGVDVESGGWGSGSDLGEPSTPWAQALADSRSVQVLSTLTGYPVTTLVPDRSVNAFDFVDDSSDHLRVVVPDVTIPVSPTGAYPRTPLALPVLQQGQIYLVDGTNLTVVQLLQVLASTQDEIDQEHLSSAPLEELR